MYRRLCDRVSLGHAWRGRPQLLQQRDRLGRIAVDQRARPCDQQLIGALDELAVYLENLAALGLGISARTLRYKLARLRAAGVDVSNEILMAGSAA